MDIELSCEIERDSIPEFNQDILDGLAYKGLLHAKEEVDALISCAEKSFPDGFEFLESSICSPQKTYRVMATQGIRGGKKLSPVDLAPSDMFLVEYRFAFEGQPLTPRYFFLPFVRKGGLITIVGKQFAISPVLADPGFSVGEDHIFIRLPRALVTFRQFFQPIVVDGVETRCFLPYSKLHNKSAGKDKRYVSDTIRLGAVHTTLPHYLFCRYGLKEAFKLAANADVTVTTEEALKAEPINQEEYVVFTSRKIPPATLKNKKDYGLLATNIALVVPRKQTSQVVNKLVSGFYYILDHYPDSNDIESLESAWFWKVAMGYVLWGDRTGISKLAENVESHLNTLDDYIDLIARNTLREEEGLEIDNIYQLFTYIFRHMEELIEVRGNDVGSMYGKRLMTSTYVLRNISNRIFKCLFAIINNRKRVYTASHFNKILGNFFSPAAILELRNTSENPFMSTVSYPGDNYLYKLTTRVVMQSNAGGNSKSQNLNVNDPAVWLHASVLEAGNHTVLPKSIPLARSTLNPCVKLDENNTIVRKDSVRDVVDYVQDVIRRR